MKLSSSKPTSSCPFSSSFSLFNHLFPSSRLNTRNVPQYVVQVVGLRVSWTSSNRGASSSFKIGKRVGNKRGIERPWLVRYLAVVSSHSPKPLRTVGNRKRLTAPLSLRARGFLKPTSVLVLSRRFSLSLFRFVFD